MPSIHSRNSQRRRWRCFHCDEVFTSRRLAEEHFGDEAYSTPACQIGGLRPLITLIRQQERELRLYRSEDSHVLRTLWNLQADHARALRSEEEKGYAKGLHDGMAESKRGHGNQLVAELELKVRGADAVITAIERAIPDWRSYRDLVDAVECKLAETRR